MLSRDLRGGARRRPVCRLPAPALERRRQRHPALPRDSGTGLPRRRVGRPTSSAAVPHRAPRGHAPDPGPKPPSVREVTSWIRTHPEHLRDEDASSLHRLRERDPELDQLTLHVVKFAVMMTARDGDRLEDGITEVERDSLAPLAGFARNLRRDFDAVRNGLSLPYSSGAVEGNINRLKMLKRQMFGRAGLDLLCKRVLLSR
ncbi:transposase [Streptomyces sp. NPDC056255]|uniref:transposase n=1 Tax=Streptomyces sp. NPDC056255 TaxID=3345764 RepID=UPI0035D6ED5F